MFIYRYKFVQIYTDNIHFHYYQFIFCKFYTDNGYFYDYRFIFEYFYTKRTSRLEVLFKQVFNYEYGETIDLFCCVVAKHNIRTQNKYIPVIDLKTIENLFSTHSLNDVFHIIRNHEYEVKPKENIQQKNPLFIEN